MYLLLWGNFPKVPRGQRKRLTTPAVKEEFPGELTERSLPCSEMASLQRRGTCQHRWLVAMWHVLVTELCNLKQ